jgi:hypothetical protein
VTFEKVRKNSTGRKSKGKNTVKKVRESLFRKSTKKIMKKYAKKNIISIQRSPEGLPLDGWGARMRDLKRSKMNLFKAKED